MFIKFFKNLDNVKYRFLKIKFVGLFNGECRKGFSVRIFTPAVRRSRCGPRQRSQRLSSFTKPT